MSSENLCGGGEKLTKKRPFGALYPEIIGYVHFSHSGKLIQCGLIQLSQWQFQNIRLLYFFLLPLRVLMSDTQGGSLWWIIKGLHGSPSPTWISFHSPFPSSFSSFLLLLLSLPRSISAWRMFQIIRDVLLLSLMAINKLKHQHGFIIILNAALKHVLLRILTEENVSSSTMLISSKNNLPCWSPLFCFSLYIANGVL